jgi:hypothetical protein
MKKIIRLTEADLTRLVSRVIQEQSKKYNTIASCVSMGVKSPGQCDTQGKKPVKSCASLGVKTPGYCYVDTKKPIPNQEPKGKDSIKEQYNRKIQDTNGIPCVKQKFVFQTYKITDPKLLSKLQGKINPKPVLSEKNVLVYDTTNISLPEKKLGTLTFYSEGNKLGTMSLDGTALGDELYDIQQKVYVDQGSDMFKIGWVFCNGALYLYDIFGEKEKQNGRI